MTIDGESIAPENPEPFADDHALVFRKLFSNSEQARLMIEATSLFPDTVEGTQAAFNVMALIDELHMTRYDDVEAMFGRIRTIFETWKIHL